MITKATRKANQNLYFYQKFTFKNGTLQSKKYKITMAKKFNETDNKILSMCK